MTPIVSHIDGQYKLLLKNILNHGYSYDDPYRKGVKRIEISHATISHDLRHSFPAISVKKLFFDTVQNELLAFLSGSTDIIDFWGRGVGIWDDDAYKFYVRRCKHHSISYVDQDTWKNIIESGHTPERSLYFDGSLGKIYPYQWRRWGTESYRVDHEKASVLGIVTEKTDQITSVIDKMRTKPLATDIILTAWNPSQLPEMALPPCHYGFQILGQPLALDTRFHFWFHKNKPNRDVVDYVEGLSVEEQHDYFNKVGIHKNGFILEWQQRSVDTFLGLPFNIASYALLAHVLGAMTGMTPLGIIGNLKKVHLYDNAIEAAEQVVRTSLEGVTTPDLIIPEGVEVDYTIDNFLDSMVGKKFELSNYKPLDPVRVKMLPRD